MKLVTYNASEEVIKGIEAGEVLAGILRRPINRGRLWAYFRTFESPASLPARRKL